jgi:hypothetical protein
MVERAMRGKRFSESQIIPLGLADGGVTAVMQPAVSTQAGQRSPRFKLFSILLLLPAIIILSPPILVALLGIFVIWLVIVGGMAAAIVMSDLIERSMWRLRHAPRALDHRAVPAGQ